MSGKLIPFDFKKNEVLMKSMIIQTVEGKEAIKYKIEKLLRTDRKRANIYKNSEYGIDKESVQNKEFYSHQIEVDDLKNDIEKSILIIDGVLSVDGLTCISEDSKLTISFSVNTIYGTIGGVVY